MYLFALIDEDDSLWLDKDADEADDDDAERDIDGEGKAGDGSQDESDEAWAIVGWYGSLTLPNGLG